MQANQPEKCPQTSTVFSSRFSKRHFRKSPGFAVSRKRFSGPEGRNSPSFGVFHKFTPPTTATTLYNKLNQTISRVRACTRGKGKVMKKTIPSIAKDAIVALVFEFIWILFIIEFSAKLASDFFIFIPACIFAIGLLILLGYLNPKFYIVIAACFVYFLIFPFFDKLFSDGFYAWEMGENGGWEKILHIAFWFVSLILQILALVVGKLISNRKNNK